ncbi:MAG: DegV family protein [Bacilli bacterium]|nr:DegV family protein [Bacilli bacterium]
MKIALSTQSSADLSPELIEKLGAHIVPFTIVLGEETFADGERPIEDLFDYFDKTGKLPRTSAINVAQYQEHYAALLKDHDCVIHISMSKECSSAFNNAMAAAEDYKGKVFIVDSTVFHSGLALLVCYARALIDKGLEPVEIVKRLIARASFISTTATLETTKYLVAGGRCNALVGLGANLLKLRPMVRMKHGKLGSYKKFRGPRKKWVPEYIDEVLSLNDNPDHHLVFVSSTTEMDEWVALAKERLEKAGFKNVIYLKAGATIGVHTGPGTFSIEMFNDGDHEW